MADTQTPGAPLPPSDADFEAEHERLLDDPDIQQAMAKATQAEADSDKALTPPQEEDTGFSPLDWLRGKAKKASAGLKSIAADVNPVLPTKVDLSSVAGAPDDYTKPDPTNETPGVGTTIKNVGRAATSSLSQIDQAVTKGVFKAGNELGKTATEIGGAVVNAGKELLSDDKQDEFRKWYTKSSNDWTVDVPGTGMSLLTSEEHLDKWAGKSREGVLGFVEGAAQFSAGMAVAGAGLKALEAAPAIGAAFKALNNTKFLKTSAEGLFTSLAAFDPYAKRLSNMLVDAPDWFGKPITDFIAKPLASREDDGKAIARIRAGLEGWLTGTAIEGVLFAAKLLRFKALGKGVKVSPGDLPVPPEGPHPADGPARVVSTPEGHAVEVVPPEEFHIEEYKPSEVAPISVKTVGEIEPNQSNVIKRSDGKVVIRASEPQPVGPHKVFDIELDDPKAAEHIAALNDKNAQTSVSREVAAEMTPEQWKAAEPALFPRKPEGVQSETVASKPKSLMRKSLKNSIGDAEAEAAAINMAVKNGEKVGKQFIGPEQQQEFFKALKGYQDTQDPRQVAQILETYGYNPGYHQQAEHVVNQVKALVDAAPEASALARKSRSWEEVRDAAAKLFPDLKDDGAIQNASKLFGGVEALPENLLALRAWMWHQAGEVSKLSKMAAAMPENATIADQHMAALDTLFQVHSKLTGAQTRTAQGLNILAHPLGEITEQLGNAAKAGAEDAPAAAAAASGPAHRAPTTYPVVAGMSKREIQALSNQLAMCGPDDLEKMLKLVSGPKASDLAVAPPAIKKSFGKFVNTYRAEALLSAPTTQLGNVISNAGIAIKRPLQYFWAGVESGDKQLADEGLDIMGGLFTHWFESAKMATEAFKQGKNLIDGAASPLEHGADDLLAMDRANLKWSVDGLGNATHILTRMPSRMLLSADEFFKQLSARAYTRAQVFKQARAEGITDAVTLAQRATDSMKVAFDPEGGCTFPAAVKYAKEVTFTEDLGPRSQKLLDVLHSNEATKFVVPFYKTPANIFSHAWEEAPGLNLLNKKLVEDLNSGGPRAAIARSKADFGAMMYGMAGWLALAGKITGSGPMDPELRKQWIQAGNQPYSVKIGTAQFSYRRGDPLTTALGMVADIISMSGELDENSKTSAAAVAMATMANNVTNKTYLASLSDFLDAVGSGKVSDSNALLGSAASSLIPNVANKANTDDYMREAVSVVDKMKARVPGLSDKLPAQRNIFGEKVMKPPNWSNRFFNPFTFMGSPKNGDLQAELLKLGKALPMPSENWAQGKIDLRNAELYGPDRKGQAPYDRWLEMMSSPPWGGKNIRELTETIVKSEAYTSLKGENAWGPGGGRYMLVSEVIRGFQDAARSQLLKEYPSLLQDLIKFDATTAAGMIGGRARAQEVSNSVEQMFQQQ